MKKGYDFSQVEKIKRQYTTEYIEQDVFTFRENNYEKGNIDSLIRGFLRIYCCNLKVQNAKRLMMPISEVFPLFAKTTFLNDLDVVAICLLYPKNCSF